MGKAENLRTETFPFGIASISLGQVDRQIPADEPPALPPNSELAVIGKPIPRQNGRAKVTGEIHFTADIALPGMLHGRVLRSPMPHALVRSIDLSAAARHPGVRVVLPLVTPDAPESATVRYAGAPVAAVAAVSIAAANEALRLIRVDYQQLPFVADIDRAREPGAPAVYDAAHGAARPSLRFPRDIQAAVERQRAWTGRRQAG